MYEWLEIEVAAIRTPKFHVIDRTAKLRAVGLEYFDLNLPPDYLEFLLKFGTAKLYRSPDQDWYEVGVLAPSVPDKLRDHEPFRAIGWDDDATVYWDSSRDGKQRPIYGRQNASFEVIATSFEEWLKESCNSARQSFGDRWASILKGPVPFTPDEHEILAARRAIRWKHVGADEDGMHAFEVSNTGSARLTAFTLGVRSRDRQLNGAVRLETGQINGGETRMIRRSCYEDIVPWADLEFFDLPDPEPQDRERYFEFS